jgi:cell wall-associated NlpC family hydrolase
MASVSGLSEAKRRKARELTVQAAMLGYRQKIKIHYTTKVSLRWEGIDDDRQAAAGEYPEYVDCSSFVTWCEWNGLWVPFKARDTVNGAGWRWGNTASMLKNGKRVVHLANVLPADVVIYGDGGGGKHASIVVGRREGVPMVVSHGSEGGPYYLTWDYRKDVMQIRRFI